MPIPPQVSGWSDRCYFDNQ